MILAPFNTEESLRIFTTKNELATFLSGIKKQHKTIGFIPTMGALHQGHLSLIQSAKNQTDVTVCSIFVNPTQFNDPSDLEKYPRPIHEDIQRLEAVECDVLFKPEIGEMYGEHESWHLALGELENILEGKFRPNHYQGVTQIVKKLFDAVKPDLAFFGQKDFQQVLVIDKMIGHFALPIKLVMCPIVRDPDGLAMSSRNVHLSKIEREQALALSKALEMTRKHFTEKSIPELTATAKTFLNKCEGVKLEYFEICNTRTLKSATSKETEELVALVAAYIGKTRLIDNLILK